MKLSQQTSQSANVIRNYSAGTLVVALPVATTLNPSNTKAESSNFTYQEEKITKSVIIAPNHIIRDWPPQSVSELTEQHFNEITDLKPEILLVGTGEKLHFLPQKFIHLLGMQGLGVEVMATNAACRTYSILSADGRFVVAALFM